LRKAEWLHGLFGRTTLLSDAPPRVLELKPGRNRRVHWSSLVRRRDHSTVLTGELERGSACSSTRFNPRCVSPEITADRVLLK
jgi:hypothetical protein